MARSKQVIEFVYECLSGWYFELLDLLVGYIGKDLDQAAQAVAVGN
jgi:hypothetical protein